MTKKGQKLVGALLFLPCSPILYYRFKSLVLLDNRRHFGLFNERKIVLWKPFMTGDIFVTLPLRDDDFVTR